MSNYDFAESVFHFMEETGAKPKASLKLASARKLIAYFSSYFASEFFEYRLIECSAKDLNLTKDAFIHKSGDTSASFYELANGKIISKNGTTASLALSEFVGFSLLKISKSVKPHSEESFYKSLDGMTPRTGYLAVPLVIFGILSPLYSNVFNSRLVYTDTNTTFLVITAFFLFFIFFEYISRKYIKHHTATIVQKNMHALSDYFYDLYRFSRAENLSVKLRSIEQAALFKWENIPLLYVDIAFITLYAFCLILLLKFFALGLMAYYIAMACLMYFVRFSSYKDLIESLKMSGEKFSFLISFERKRRELKYSKNNASANVFTNNYAIDEINRITLDTQNFKWSEITKANTFISMAVMYFCCFLAIKAEMLQISTVLAVMIINSRLSSSLASVLARLYQIKVQKHHFFESSTAIYKDIHTNDGVASGMVERLKAKALTNEILASKGFIPLNYEFEAGKFYAITGPSGIGKTTLLRMLAGEDMLYMGQLLVNENSIKNISHDSFSKNFAIHYANMDFLKLSLKENFSFYGVNSIDMVTQILRFASPKFELDYEKFEVIEAEQLRFSNGEKQKLLLGMVLAKKPSIILLDESTSFLSASDSIKTVQWLKTQHKDAIIIIATHDVNVINLADDCIRLGQSAKVIKL